MQLPSPKTKGGKTATQGFDYQTGCALIEAIKLCATQKIFYLQQEWLDDITILDCNISPSTIRYIQVKSGSKQTLAKVTLKKSLKNGDRRPSIIQNAIDNLFLIPDLNSQSEIHSETGFDFTDDNLVPLDQLDIGNVKTKANIKQRYHEQITDCTQLDKIVLVTPAVGFEGHRAQCEQQVGKFFQTFFQTTAVNQFATTDTILEVIRTKGRNPHPEQLPISQDHMFSHQDMEQIAESALSVSKAPDLAEFIPNFVNLHRNDKPKYYAAWRGIKSETNPDKLRNFEKINTIVNDLKRQPILANLNDEDFFQHAFEVAKTDDLTDTTIKEILIWHAIEYGSENKQHSEVNQYFKGFEKWK